MSRGKQSSAITVIENLDNGETLFFLNTSQLAFLQDSRIDYSPKIRTLIRVMDDGPDIYHHYIVYKMPPIIDMIKMVGEIR